MCVLLNFNGFGVILLVMMRYFGVFCMFFDGLVRAEARLER